MWILGMTCLPKNRSVWLSCSPTSCKSWNFKNSPALLLPFTGILFKAIMAHFLLNFVNKRIYPPRFSQTCRKKASKRACCVTSAEFAQISSPLAYQLSWLLKHRFDPVPWFLTFAQLLWWLDGPEFEWTPGVGDGQGGLACCNSWDRKESDTTERLNWTMMGNLVGPHVSALSSALSRTSLPLQSVLHHPFPSLKHQWSHKRLWEEQVWPPQMPTSPSPI